MYEGQILASLLTLNTTLLCEAPCATSQETLGRPWSLKVHSLSPVHNSCCLVSPIELHFICTAHEPCDSYQFNELLRLTNLQLEKDPFSQCDADL